MPLRMRDSRPHAKTKLPFLGSMTGRSSRETVSTSESSFSRNSRHQARELRGFLNHQEKAAPAALPKFADGALLVRFGAYGVTLALILDDENSPVLELGDKIGIELFRRAREIKGVTMARDVADPEIHLRQAVDAFSALWLLAVDLAAESGYVVLS